MKPSARINANVQEEIIEAACAAIAGNRTLRRTISSALSNGFDEALGLIRSKMVEKAEAIRVTGSVMNLSDGFLELTVRTGSNSTTVNLFDHIEKGIAEAKTVTNPEAIARVLVGVEAFATALASFKAALVEQQQILQSQATRKSS